MSRFRRNKDTAHPAVVAALLRAGCLVMVLEQARWAGGGRKQQVAGAPDLLVTLRGRTVALEVKTPKAKKSKAQKDQEEHQKHFAVVAEVAGLEVYKVSTPLGALAVMNCTPAEARRGLLAGKDGHTWAVLSLTGLAAHIAAARVNMGIDPPRFIPTTEMLPPMRLGVSAVDAACNNCGHAIAAGTRHVPMPPDMHCSMVDVESPPPMRSKAPILATRRFAVKPNPAYPPPRTDFGKCSEPECEGRCYDMVGLCAAHEVEAIERKHGVKK